MSANETAFDADGNIVEQTVDNGDGTGTRTVYDGKGNVTSTEQVDGLPIVDIDTSHASDDPLAAEVARLSSLLEAVLADPEIAKVSDLSAQLAAQNATIEALLNALGGTP